MVFPLAARGLLPRTLTMAVLSALASGVYAQSTADEDGRVMRLQDIVVSASGFEQAVQDAPASITVVPREELAKRAYPDVTEALRDIPGVVVTGGGSGSDISIRGMGSDYSLLLIDGVRQNTRETRPNGDNAGIEQGWMPPLEAIERIEVIRGPMSSLYGSEAMGGVINIITRKVARDWHGSFRSESTMQEDSNSGNIYAGNFHVSGPLKENLLGIQVYGNVSRRIEDRFKGGFNKQETHAGKAKLSLTPTADHDLSLEVGRTLQDKVVTPGRSTDDAPSCNQDGLCTPKTVSAAHYSRTSSTLSHNGRYGAVSSNTYLSREETNNPGRSMRLKNTEINSQWTLPMASHMMTAGASYINEDLSDEGNQLSSSTRSQLERYQWSLYAEDEWSLLDSFALTGGVRLTHDENYGSHWTPRLYGVWHATDNFSLKGGVSTGFRAPDLRAAVADWGQITGGSGDPAVIVGNPGLKPEKSINEEISLNWDNRDNFAASLTAYHTHFKDKIASTYRCRDTASNGDSIASGNCNIDGVLYKFIQDRINVDRATIRGVESTLTWQLMDQLRLAGNYTYTHSEQKSGAAKGYALNKLPKHMANATLDYTPTDHLGLWTRVNFRGQSQDYLGRDKVSVTPSFTFADLGGNYRVSRHLSLGVAVYNLFDKRVTSEDYGMVYDGRRYWASATVTL